MLARFCPSLAADAPVLSLQQMLREQCHRGVSMGGSDLGYIAGLVLLQQCCSSVFFSFPYATGVYKLVHTD